MGFAKTSNLSPNKSETVQIKVNLKDLTSYDINANNGKGAYILDEGDYYITAASNAHEAINQILYKKMENENNFYSNKNRIADIVKDSSDFAENENSVYVYNHANYDSTRYLKIGTNLREIENQFANSKLEDAKYLSRSNWEMMENNGLRYGTPSSTVSKAEINGKQFQSEIS